MTGLIKHLLFLHVVVAALCGLMFWAVITDRFPAMPEVPEIESRWFGYDERKPEDESVRKFEIKVEQKVRQKKRQRKYKSGKVGKKAAKNSR